MNAKWLLGGCFLMFSLLGFLSPVRAASLVAVGPGQLSVASHPVPFSDTLPTPAALKDLTPSARRVVSSAVDLILNASARSEPGGAAAQLSAQQSAQTAVQNLLEAQPEIVAMPLFSIKTIPTVNNRANDLPTLADTESETTVAIFGNNVVVGFNSDPDLVNFGIGFTGYSHSSNRGKTFTEVNGGLPQASAGAHNLIPLGDPYVVADSSGNFYFSTLAEDAITTESWILLYKSTDAGVTFAPLSGVRAGNTVDFLDKELISIDRNLNLIYLTFTNFINGGAGGLEVFSIPISTAGAPGTAVALNNPATSAGSGSMPAVGPNGEVYVAWEQFDPTEAIVFVKSTNLGVSFSSIATVSLVDAVSDAGATSACGRSALRGGIRENDFPSIAVDTGAKSKFKGNVTLPGTICPVVTLISSFPDLPMAALPGVLRSESTKTRRVTEPINLCLGLA